MKKYILFILMAYCSIAYLQAQSWQWAQRGGGDNYDYGKDICVDNNGNTYVSGMVMYYSAWFGTDTFNVNGYDDMFIAKYAPNGDFLWVKRFGGSNSILNYDSEADCRLMYDSASNALYLTGKYFTECYFGSFHFTTEEDDWNMFIAKFDTDGNCLWANQGGSNGGDAGLGLAVGNDGIVYQVGGCQYQGSIGAIPVQAGDFLAKYNQSGNCIYAKKLFNGLLPTDIKVLDSSLYIVGHVYDSIVTIDTHTYNLHLNYPCRALIKADTSGNVRWTKFFGGPSYSFGWKFAMDQQGNCYVPGVFTGPYVTFDDDTVFCKKYYQYYLAKFDRNGNTKWVQAGDVTGGIMVNDIYYDRSNNIYITGALYDTVSFGSYTLTSPSDDYTLYITRYDSSGNCMGVVDNQYATANGVTCDRSGSIYVTGVFRGTLNFGSFTLNGPENGDVLTCKVAPFTGMNGVNKSSGNSQLYIYANPNSGQCNIQIPEDLMNEDALVLSIYNLDGLLIQQQTLYLAEDKISLNLQAEAKGVYVATLTNGKQMYSGKIIFE